MIIYYFSLFPSLLSSILGVLYVSSAHLPALVMGLFGKKIILNVDHVPVRQLVQFATLITKKVISSLIVPSATDGYTVNVTAWTMKMTVK